MYKKLIKALFVLPLGMMGHSFTEASRPVEAIYYQAHRGGLNEVPENTLAALRHAWARSGAVPEIDLRTTSDGVIVCIHDETPDRTLKTPEPWRGKRIREIEYGVLKQWDAGSHFAPEYAQERVPALEEVLLMMKEEPRHQLYLDLKDVDTDAVYKLMEGHDLTSRIIFVHGDVAKCIMLQETYPGVRTMTWLSGSQQKIRDRFAELEKTGFQGISQVQFHLRAREAAGPIEFELPWGFLEQAAGSTQAHGVDLQVRPFRFDHRVLSRLTGMGIRWFVTDDPEAFEAALSETEGALPSL